GPQDAQAFPLGGGGQPARQRGRHAQVPELLHQEQPHRLADVVDIGAVQLVTVADGPHKWGIALHEFVPGVLVAVAGPFDQPEDCWIVTHEVSLRASVSGSRWRAGCRGRADPGRDRATLTTHTYSPAQSRVPQHLSREEGRRGPPDTTRRRGYSGA